MLGECVEGALVRSAVLYWCASALALAMRLACSDFAALSAYGGRNSVAASASAPSGSGPSPPLLSPSRAGAPYTQWASAPVRWLASSRLGHTRVARRQSFSAFYITGLATSITLLLARWTVAGGAVGDSLSPSSGPLPITSAPLALFTLHCAVRLAETRRVQRFRPDDDVTLFAAVAGSSFYVAAAISSAAPVHSRTPHSAHWLHRSLVVRTVFAVGVAAHLSLQAVQVVAHTILAHLRPEQIDVEATNKRSPAADWEEGAWRQVLTRVSCPAGTAQNGASGGQRVGAVSATAPELHGPWRRYRYPYACNACFRVALDPHYTCEVGMYAFNTVLLFLCVFPDAALPSARGGRGVWGCLAAGDGGGASRCFACGSVPGLPVLASLGVTLFTAANLSITAAGHRRFWMNVSVTHRHVAAALQAFLSEAAAVPRSQSEAAPAEVLHAAACLLAEVATEEVLPKWNVFPLVW